MSKLIVKIKDPSLGKGWYVVPAEHQTTADDATITYGIRRTQPDATAVQIIRQYTLRETS